MAVTVYKSTDASAPTLSGTAGDLTTLLDAVLVNGYGSKAAAGWTIDKTASNKRIYKQAGGNQLFLRVRDNSGGTGGAQEAQIRAGEADSDVDTLTNGMPTSGQSALTDNSLIVRKSVAANGTTRSWIVVADTKTLYMFIATGDNAGVYSSWGFGDFYSHLTADGYRNMIIARATENSGATTSSTDVFGSFNVSNIASTGHYIQRNRNGLAGSLNFGKCAFAFQPAPSNGSGMGQNTGFPWPNGEDGGLYLSPIYFLDYATAPSFSIRGRLRGIWHCGHAPAGFNDGDTFTGVGDFSGKTFLIIKSVYGGGVAGLCVVETSDTWDASS